jgi:hypothetical protein
MAPSWWAYGDTVVGANHAQRGLPGQDAILVRTVHSYPDGRAASCHLIAVADGHGAPKHFPSGRGAHFAVLAAEGMSQMLLEGPKSNAESIAERTYISRLLRSELPRQLMAYWRAAVRSDIGQDPFTEAELQLLGIGTPLPHHDEPMPGRTPTTELLPLAAYGTTLAFALVTDDVLICCSIGDCDIVVVDANGVAQRVFPEDNDAGDETDSMCSNDPESRIRTTLIAIREEAPAAVILTTDGFAKSYRNDEDFMSTAGAYAHALAERGLAGTADNLHRWLARTTRDGSGDDVSFGILCNKSRRTSGSAPAQENDTVVLASVPPEDAGLVTNSELDDSPAAPDHSTAATRVQSSSPDSSPMATDASPLDTEQERNEDVEQLLESD